MLRSIFRDVCGACWLSEGVGHGEFGNVLLGLRLFCFGLVWFVVVVVGMLVMMGMATLNDERMVES